jgi:hypothetical protein
MTRATCSLFIGLIWVVAIPSPIDASDEELIYSCDDGDGTIVIQTDPCPEPRAKVPAPPPPEKKPAVAQPARAKPKPVPTVRTATTRWTLVPPSESLAPRPVRRLGKQRFQVSLSGETASATPSFVTPARTWQTFLFAIEQGDRAAAVTCLTPSALDALLPGAGSFPLDELRTMVAGFSRIENVGDLGPYWSIYGVRRRQRPKWIFFEETKPGEWKISGI